VVADVLVVSASVPQLLTDTRNASLEDNAAIVAELADRLAGWDGVLLMVTNPIEPLAMVARARTGLAVERVLGYALNDTLRLRTAIAGVVGAPPGEIDACALGEHGPGVVPIYSRVFRAGAPLDLSAGQRAAASAFVTGWFARHVALNSGRSSTWTTGLGIAQMVDELRAPTGTALPASVALRGEYGIEGVSLTVPVVLGPGGVQRIESWELDPDEAEAMRRAAGQVAETAARIGAGPAPGQPGRSPSSFTRS
jgi:malate dehydrogenase